MIDSEFRDFLVRGEIIINSPLAHFSFSGEGGVLRGVIVNLSLLLSVIQGWVLIKLLDSKSDQHLILPKVIQLNHSLRS